jgi:hypothetical protein
LPYKARTAAEDGGAASVDRPFLANLLLTLKKRFNKHACRWPANQVKLTRSTTEALTGSLEEPVQPANPKPESADKAAISRSLHNACFYLTVDWWSYGEDEAV